MSAQEADFMLPGPVVFVVLNRKFRHPEMGRLVSLCNKIQAARRREEHALLLEQEEQASDYWEIFKSRLGIIGMVLWFLTILQVVLIVLKAIHS